ncbi:MAG: HAD-IA family hydrolase [Candidatus Levyibacteriota bacterium]
MIKVILFDADKVLINNQRYFVEFLEEDYHINQDKTRSFFQGEYLECVVGKKNLREILPKYLQEWGWKKSLEDFLDYWHKKEHLINDPLVSYIQVLRRSGIYCCVATNQATDRFLYIQNEMGFNDKFDKLYSSAYLGVKKPDITFFKKVLEDLRISDKNTVLFWDDSPVNIEAAKVFGIYAELYTTFEDFKERMSTYVTA